MKKGSLLQFVMLVLMAPFILLAPGLALADADPAPVVTMASTSISSLPWLALLGTIVCTIGGWAVVNLLPLLKAALLAHAADKNASALSQKLSSFGAGLMTQVQASAAHIFPDAQTKIAAGETIDQIAREEGQEILNGLDGAGKALATQYLGTGGAALLDILEGLIKDLVQKKVTAAQAAGTVAAAAAVPVAPPAVAGPKATTALDAMTAAKTS